MYVQYFYFCCCFCSHFVIFFSFFCYFTINKIVFLLLVQCVYVGGEGSMENNKSSNKLLKKNKERMKVLERVASFISI